jgi:hypothetical protein
MKLVSSILTLLSMFPIYVSACSCGVASGDTVVQLKILTDRLSAQKIEVINDRGQRQRLLKYEVAVVDVKRGDFHSNYILTGYGGGDCGIKFEKNSTFTFIFWKKQFEAIPQLGWCNLTRSS